MTFQEPLIQMYKGFFFVEKFISFIPSFRQNVQAFSGILNYMKDLRYEV